MEQGDRSGTYRRASQYVRVLTVLTTAHFVDLSRYFAGEVNLASVKAHAVEWNEKPGQLSQIQIDESAIPEQDRIPRFTSATWKYENGAIGHLEHGVALQGQTFFTEIVVCKSTYIYIADDRCGRISDEAV